MVREYELMYIVRPELDDEALQTTVESVKTLIEGHGGEVAKTTMWGKRRLAYEVKHLRDGHYVILKLRLDGTKVVAIERALRIHDTVFRHLLVVDELGIGPETEEERDQAADDYAAAGTRPASTDAATDSSTDDAGAADEPAKEPAVAVAAGGDETEEAN